MEPRELDWPAVVRLSWVGWVELVVVVATVVVQAQAWTAKIHMEILEAAAAAVLAWPWALVEPTA
tara:strand:+ start:215 stop:409 length:195 start_codon:yes stop_codon:yes gene_type:complete